LIIIICHWYKNKLKKALGALLYERYRIYSAYKPASRMRLTVLLTLIVLFSVKTFSQGILKGKITDSTSKKPLGLATITVFKAADTAIITYRLSTPEGEFKVPGLP